MATGDEVWHRRDKAHPLAITDPDAGFLIEGWTVDPRTNGLQKDGKRVRLEPKVMELLVYLVRRPGQVISREQLEDDVWNGLALSYDTVTGAIQKLRKALGDDARNARAIETISKKGYRLIAPVCPLKRQESVLASAQRGDTKSGFLPRRVLISISAALLAGLAALAVYRTSAGIGTGHTIADTSSLKSLAILPFRNIGGDPAQDYFADGITIDLITDVSKISGLFVIAQNSTFTYKGHSAGLDDIARELGVRYIVEGSVRRAQKHVRVNVSLADAETGRYLWTERFDSSLADVFALQDKLTRQIASALEVTLTPNEEIGLSQYSKVDPQAYDLYLQGRARVAVYSPQANAEARDFFESAIARDPSFGRAHAGLALTHAVDATFGWSADAELSREKAARHARTALAIDSISPQMHYVLAQIYGSQRRIEDGIQELRQAVALDPNYADGHVVLGLFLAYAGKPEEAIVSIRKGMKLSPRHGYIYPYTLSNAYFVMGRYDEAASIIEGVLERNNNFQQGRLLLISIYGLLGRTEDAEWEIAELLTALPDFSIADEETRVRFTYREARERYIEGLRKSGLP